MAAAVEVLQELQREITCSICWSYFSEPITIGCGHSFCRVCLSWSWRLSAATSSCPECRQVSQLREFLAVNGLLAQLTDQGKQLCSMLLQSTEGQSQCARHKQVLKLFCEDEQTLLCVRCSQSPEHEAHKISPVEEAAKKCKEKLQHIRSHLKKQLEEAEEERPAVDWHTMIRREYNNLHHFLMEEQFRCVERVKKEQRASRDRLSQHMQTLQDLMLELQEAGRQPSVELLQGVKELLGRSKAVLSQRVKAVFPELREYPIPGSIEMLRRFRVDITMDPTAASPCVTVSEDLKSVKIGEGWRVESGHPENCAFHGVLATKAFSSGRQYWEVDVTQLPEWMLGIYIPNLRRKRDRNMNAYDSVFLLHCNKKEEDYYLQTYPESLKHRIKNRMPRIGVYLEYISGTLGFYNVLHHSLIYRFHSIPFTGPVIPFFSPGIPLPGTKVGPMTLCPMDSHLCASCYSCL